MGLRLLHATDVHLDIARRAESLANARGVIGPIERFLGDVRRSGADALLVGGDIAETGSMATLLPRLADAGVPVYFVLGNHDAYGGSVDGSRIVADQISRRTPGLHYLESSSRTAPVMLTARVALVGVSGWADGRAADRTDQHGGKISGFLTSRMQLRDYDEIADFRGLKKPALREALAHQGKLAARRLRRQLDRVPADVEHVVILCHVPPWRQAAWYRGQPSDDESVPHFVWQAGGEMLTRWRRDRTDVRVTVLCGHTHAAADVHVDGMHVLCGHAIYGEPRIARVLDI